MRTEQDALIERDAGNQNELTTTPEKLKFILRIIEMLATDKGYLGKTIFLQRNNIFSLLAPFNSLIAPLKP